MIAQEIRNAYLEFFKIKGHKQIPGASLIPQNDPTTLFTSSGMQQLVPYLKGEPHPLGKRLVDSQPSLRLQDIDEVGDNRHTTFFEMLGNWSLGDYFKKEQIAWCLEFLTKELELPQEKLFVSVFEGTKEIPRDEETARIWKNLGIKEEKIFYYPAQKNWWSRSGTPKEMPEGEIGGPDSEVFFDFGTPHDPKFGQDCHPNCDCGRFMEIGNSVFIQYEKEVDGSLVELPQKNVDFGGGLERMAAAVNNNHDIFRIDIFSPIMSKVEEVHSYSYGQDPKKDKSIRIIADHLRAALMLIKDGVVPGNKQQSYVLRRLIRRAVFHEQELFKKTNDSALSSLAEGLQEKYPELQEKWAETAKVLDDEYTRFNKLLQEGKIRLTKALEKGTSIDGKLAFDLYQTNGFPLELTTEILESSGMTLANEEKNQFAEEFKKHQELSRTASAGVFKGGLADHSEIVTRYHTATHLLQAALRKILGESVHQKGSNLTTDRLRFDFSYFERLTDEQVSKVENTINEQIEKNLPVGLETTSLEEAINNGALTIPGEKYPETVKVYSIDNFSKEICGGPHVGATGILGRLRIIKEESAGSGTRRIYAVLENRK